MKEGHLGTPHHLFYSSVNLKLFKNEKPIKKKKAQMLETAGGVKSGGSSSGLFDFGQGTQLSSLSFPVWKTSLIIKQCLPRKG